ncbi:MAG: hypothetical protein K5669_12805 [Lachnospiraceae bacterium]|nr:hypothetical protein [Lachnospiraceae bacterium]
MLIVLILLLLFRLLGFILKVAGGVIKIIFRILIIPVLILTAIWGYPIIAIAVGAVVFLVWIIGAALRRR